MQHLSRHCYDAGRDLQGSVSGEACGCGEWQRKEVAAECLHACVCSEGVKRLAVQGVICRVSTGGSTVNAQHMSKIEQNTMD